MLLRVRCDSVCDRARDVVGAHDVAAVIGLEPAAVSGTVIDGFDPRLRLRDCSAPPYRAAVG
jgi:hypothetical protein